MTSRTFKRDEVLTMLSDDDNESVQGDNYSNKSDFESERIVVMNPIMMNRLASTMITVQMFVIITERCECPSLN